MSDIAEIQKRADVLKELDEYRDTLGKRKQQYVKCNNCKHVLTHSETATIAYGAHTHVRTNPYGNEFSFCCFNEALGCAIEGEPVSADSWFPNCVWQYLYCESCNQHLGWYFTGESSFYGIREDHSYIE